MFVLKLFFLLTVTTCAVTSYKILGIHQLATGSHRILVTKLFKDIAKKGHQVTLFTPYKSKEKIENLEEVTMPELQKIAEEFGKTLVNQEQTPYERAQFMNNIQFALTKYMLSCKEMQDLLNGNHHFDAIIIHQFLNEGLVPLGTHFKAPVILFSPMPLFVTESFFLKHPAPSSYVPNLLIGYTGRMTFWQRLRNSFYDVCIILKYMWSTLPEYQELVSRHIPGNLKVQDALSNVSLLLINAHASTNEALPLVPNAIEIGGYHIEDPKPLPAELQQYLDECSNGTVLFSMGSITKSVNLPEDKRNALIRAFSKLQINVLWKWEGDELPNKPKNVKTLKWIPQNDVLAHPNVKAFITHGGLLSTMEGVYHAKPLIGIPIFADQKMNLALAKAYEYAVEVPYKDLSEQKLSEALDQILNNPKYKRNIEQRSKLMHDRPMKPSETALYWIEYVIRHKGAPHLRYPGIDLNWFERNLLDVAGFVIVVVLGMLLLVYKTIKIMCGRSKQKTE